MKPFTEAEFDKIVTELPEDAFQNLVPLLMESFGKKRGRTLDKTQIQALAIGLMEMGATIDAQVTLIGQLQKEVEECQPKKSRLWKP